MPIPAGFVEVSPEEVAGATPVSASLPAGMVEVDPFQEFDEASLLDQLQKGTLTHAALKQYALEKLPPTERADDAQLAQRLKLARVSEAYKDAGITTNDLVQMAKNTPAALWSMGKGLAHTVGKIASIVPAQMALRATLNAAPGVPDWLKTDKPVIEGAVQTGGELLGGLEAEGTGLLQMGERAGNLVLRGLGLKTPFEKLNNGQILANFDEDIASAGEMQAAAEGKGALTQAFYGPDTAAGSLLANKGMSLRPEEIQSVSEAGLLGLPAFAAGGAAVKAGVGAAAKAVLPAAALETAAKVGAKVGAITAKAEQVAGDALSKGAGHVAKAAVLGSLGAIDTAQFLGKLGPLIGLGVGAAKGGPVGAFAGMAAGEHVARRIGKILAPFRRVTKRLDQSGKNLIAATPENAGPYGRMAFDVAHATPEFLRNVGAGALDDAIFAMATSETPEEFRNQPMFGTFLRAVPAAGRVAKKFITGQEISPRNWWPKAEEANQTPYGVFPELDTMHSAAVGNADAGVQARVGALRSLASQVGGQVFLADPAQAKVFLERHKFTPEEAANAVEQRGMFIGNVPDAAGKPQKVTLLFNPEAAAHETGHIFQAAMDEKTLRVVNQIIKNDLGKHWDSAGQDYTRRVLSESAIKDAAAKNYSWQEALVRFTDNVGSNEQVTPEYVRNRSDDILASELGADIFDAIVEHGGTEMLVGRGLPGKLARILAGSLQALGQEPWEGAPVLKEAFQGEIPVTRRATQAVREAAQGAEKSAVVAPADLPPPTAAPVAPAAPTPTPGAPAPVSSDPLQVARDAASKAQQEMLSGPYDKALTPEQRQAEQDRRVKVWEAAKVEVERLKSGQKDQVAAAQKDYDLEKDFASRFLRDEVKLEDFPYFEDYQKTIDAESGLLANPKNILFIGSGPVPLSAILLVRKFPGASIEIADRSKEGLQLGADVAKKAGVTFADVSLSDATTEKDFSGYDTVVLALGAGLDQASKRQAIQSIWDNLDPNAVLLLRSSAGSTAGESFVRIRNLLPAEAKVVASTSTFGGLGETVKLVKPTAAVVPKESPTPISPIPPVSPRGETPPASETAEAPKPPAAKFVGGPEAVEKVIRDTPGTKTFQIEHAQVERDSEASRQQERDAQELARELPDDVRQKVDKIFTVRLGDDGQPRFSDTSKGRMVIGVAPIQRLVNAKRVAKMALDLDRPDLIPYPTNEIDSLSAEGWKMLYSDMEKVQWNHEHGWRGDGTGPLVVPEGTEAFVPPDTMPKDGQIFVTHDKANFVNLLNGASVAPPSGIRAAAGGVKHANVRAREIAQASSRKTDVVPRVQPLPIRSGGYFTGDLEAAIKNEAYPRAELNPLRRKLAEERFPIYTLPDVESKVHLKHIHGIVARPDVRSDAVSSDVTRAGFSPGRKASQRLWDELKDDSESWSDIAPWLLLNKDGHALRMSLVTEEVKYSDAGESGYIRETGTPRVSWRDPGYESWVRQMVARKLYGDTKVEKLLAKTPEVFSETPSEEVLKALAESSDADLTYLPAPNKPYQAPDLPKAEASEPAHSAWLMPDGRAYLVKNSAAGGYHDDAVHGFSDFDSTALQGKQGEEVVSAFQRDTGGVRVAVLSSRRKLEDGRGQIGISTSYRPTEAQLSFLKARLTAENSSGEPAYRDISVDILSPSGEVSAGKVFSGPNHKMNVGAALRFLRDPGSSDVTRAGFSPRRSREENLRRYLEKPPKQLPATVSAERISSDPDEAAFHSAWIMPDGTAYKVANSVANDHHDALARNLDKTFASTVKGLSPSDSVESFQKQYGALRVSVKESRAWLMDKGGELGISVSRLPTEAQLSRLNTWLLAEGGGGASRGGDDLFPEYRFRRIGVDVQIPGSLPQGKLFDVGNGKALAGAVKRFLRAPFSETNPLPSGWTVENKPSLNEPTHFVYSEDHQLKGSGYTREEAIADSLANDEASSDVTRAGFSPRREEDIRELYRRDPRAGVIARQIGRKIQGIKEDISRDPGEGWKEASADELASDLHVLLNLPDSPRYAEVLERYLAEAEKSGDVEVERANSAYALRQVSENKDPLIGLTQSGFTPTSPRMVKLAKLREAYSSWLPGADALLTWLHNREVRRVADDSPYSLKSRENQARELVEKAEQYARGRRNSPESVEALRSAENILNLVTARQAEADLRKAKQALDDPINWKKIEASPEGRRNARTIEAEYEGARADVALAERMVENDTGLPIPEIQKRHRQFRELLTDWKNSSGGLPKPWSQELTNARDRLFQAGDERTERLPEPTITAAPSDVHRWIQPQEGLPPLRAHFSSRRPQSLSAKEEADIAKAYRYFEIGHGPALDREGTEEGAYSKDRIWLYNPEQRSLLISDSDTTHEGEWSGVSASYKGRYDDAQKKISVRFPDSVRDRFEAEGREPTEDDIPTGVYRSLRSEFGKKAQMVVFSPKKEKWSPEQSEAERDAEIEAFEAARLARKAAQQETTKEGNLTLQPAGRDGISKAWILPNGRIQQLGAEWHHQWLEKNGDRFGLTPEEISLGEAGNREAFIRKGAARVNYQNNTGSLTVEARQRDWAKQKNSVRDLVEANLSKLDNVNIHLLNDNGTKQVDADSARLFKLKTPEEKLAALPFMEGSEAQPVAMREGVEPTPYRQAQAFPDAVTFSPGRGAKSEKGKELEKSGFEIRREPRAGGYNIEVHKDGELAGELSYWYLVPPPAKNALANILYVETRPDFRRQGVARALYHELGKELQERGVRRVGGDVISQVPMDLRRQVFGDNMTYETDIAELSEAEARRILPEQPPLDLREAWESGSSAKVWAESKVSPTQVFSPKRFTHSDLPNELDKARKGDSSGQTFNSDGSVWNPRNKKVDLVTLASVNLPQSQLTKENVVKALADKAPLLSLKGVVAGIFKLEDRKLRNAEGKLEPAWSVDLNSVVPQEYRDNSWQFAHDNGQQSIWDAKNSEVIQTGSTGDTVLTHPKDLFKAHELLQKGEVVDVGDLPILRGRSEELAGEQGGFDFLKSLEVRDPRHPSNMTRAEILKAHPEIYLPKNRADLVDISGFDESPMFKRASSEAEAVKQVGEKLVAEYRAKKHLPEVQDGAKWYSRFVPLLTQHFGADSQIMAELLAATSPRNNPTVNFQYASEALWKYKDGHYDGMIEKFLEGLDGLETGKTKAAYEEDLAAGQVANPAANPTPAAYMGHWIEKHSLKPTKANNKLFGATSDAVMQVLARVWMNEGRGPKVGNFVKNLLGVGHRATIDVWAGRLLRRLSHEGYVDQWRVLPANDAGISDRNFDLGQQAFDYAAEKLGIEADALQGALWFSEKKHWADKGWQRLNLGDYATEMKKLPELRRKYEGGEDPEKPSLGLDIRPRTR